jgi:hypothetical protein
VRATAVKVKVNMVAGKQAGNKKLVLKPFYKNVQKILVSLLT